MTAVNTNTGNSDFIHNIYKNIRGIEGSAGVDVVEPFCVPPFHKYAAW